MRSSTRIGLVGVLSAALVVGLSVAAAAKAIAESTKKYAKTVCAVYTEIPKDLDAFTTAFNTTPTTDPAALQASLTKTASDLVDQLDALGARLKKAYPDVDDGKKISTIFVNDLRRYRDKVSSALSSFKSADPNGAGFVDDQAELGSVVTVLRSSHANDPFSKVQDQDLLKAFGREKSCAKVVRIYRG